jgi:pyridoxal phosphate enzyme (YggS family)
MDHSVKNLINIKDNISSNLEILKINKFPNIIAVSKTFKLEKILPLIEHGHLDYGENKVQEAYEKWSNIKKEKLDLKLHLIGRLQTNKVKLAVRIFDFIHSVDSEKLAKKINDEQIKIDKKINIFIQVNIGNEIQKSGVTKKDLPGLISYCQSINLNILGLMCIPPINDDLGNYFKEMSILNKSFNFDELSMGMSSDYLQATANSSTYLRIGSSIFGKRF